MTPKAAQGLRLEDPPDQSPSPFVITFFKLRGEKSGQSRTAAWNIGSTIIFVWILKCGNLLNIHGNFRMWTLQKKGEPSCGSRFTVHVFSWTNNFHWRSSLLFWIFLDIFSFVGSPNLIVYFKFMDGLVVVINSSQNVKSVDELWMDLRDPKSNQVCRVKNCHDVSKHWSKVSSRLHRSGFLRWTQWCQYPKSLFSPPPMLIGQTRRSWRMHWFNLVVLMACSREQFPRPLF